MRRLGQKFTPAALPPDGEARFLRIAAERSIEMLQAEIGTAGAARVFARDAEGNTALALAAGAGREAAVRFLLKHGAEIDAANNAGETALLLAAKRGNTSMIALLLERGAAVNAADAEGRTALMHAATHKSSHPRYTHTMPRRKYETITLLLARGARLDLCDHAGQTAEAWALRQGHKRAADLIAAEAAVRAERHAKDPMVFILGIPEDLPVRPQYRLKPRPGRGQ
jgi:hypothetical protein